MYKIEGRSLTEFVDDSRIRLPRFQRREAWKKDQNFKLCISVYKEFPLGVVIINDTADASWLLDGRQRRAALEVMRNNPVEVYSWAKSFVNFKPKASDEEIRESFYRKINEYLQSADKRADALDSPMSENDEEEENLEEFEEEDVDVNSFDVKKQKESLENLLNQILMVHPIKKGVSKWESTFDFREFIPKLRYLDKSKKAIDPRALRKFIIQDLGQDCLDREVFIQHFIDYELLIEGKEEDFRNYVNLKWDQIYNSLSVIFKSENIFKNGRIGVINLTRASTLDAQNIFTLVNTGGTSLKAEELLSAKPFWNVELTDVSPELRDKVTALYSNLALTQEDNVVRWDACAVLLSRIDKNHYIFPHINENNDKSVKNKASMERITLGFKLISSLFKGGMSAKHVSKLEEFGSEFESKINMELLVEELNFLIDDVIAEINYFKFLHTWGKSIIEITTNAITLEFLVLIYKLWDKYGKPRNPASADLKALKRKAVILFDRLIHENAQGIWKGSGDSKMAGDIRPENIEERFKPIEISEWIKYIEENSWKPKPKHEVYRPFLYHYYALDGFSPLMSIGGFDSSSQINYQVDIDHIIPKEKFVDNDNYVVYKNSIGNLALLPSSENSSKKSKTLNEIRDGWTKVQIARYTGIAEEEFETFSDIVNIQQLIEKRKEHYVEVFEKKRMSLFSN